MKEITYINHLTKEDCHCGLPDFFVKISESIGYVITENTRWDCQKISCTEDARKEIFSYYRENGYNSEQIVTMWTCFGPKANLHSHSESLKYRVRLESGAIYEEGEKKND